MSNIKLSKKQLEAYSLLTDDITNELLYGGGARGGKSYLGCIWITLQCLEKPGSAWMIGRETLLALKQSTLIDLFNGFNTLGIKDFRYRQDEQMISFPNGSRIFLKGLPYEPSDPEYNYLGSLTLTGYFIDEAQEISPKAINVLRARCSLIEKMDDEGNTLWTTIPKALYTCNPDKGWVYHDFYRPYKDGTLPKNRAFIPALVIHNTFMSVDARREYINSVKSGGDKVTIQRLLYGNFDYDATKGKIFDYDALQDMFTNAHVEGLKYITADISRGGGDKTVIMVWEGYTVKQCYSWTEHDLDVAIKKIRELCDMYRIPMSRVLVDENGVGSGPFAMLKCRGFIGNRSPISPLAKKYRPELQRNYKDLRCQCLFMMSKLVNDNKVSVEDDSIKKELIEELDLICHVNIDKDEPIKLTTKVEMKEKLPLGRSPDVSDAFYMRAWFDLFLTDVELSDIERVYNPHIDEDIYGNTIAGYQKKILEEYFNECLKTPNTYTAKAPITIN